MENPREGIGKQNKAAKWIILGLISTNLFVWLVVSGAWQGHYLEVKFFDVDQGDAALAQIDGDIQILIDGGPDNKVLEKLGQTMPFYDRDIEWMVLSHTDRDHLTGLLDVIKNYRVRNIIWSGIGDNRAQDKEWERLISEETARDNAKIIFAVPGEKVDLGGNPDCQIEILAPAITDRSPSRGQNDLSVAVKLIYGKRSFVFVGDASSREESEIKSTIPELRADVLKVAHHGSKSSANEEFLASLLPAAAVISVGAKNSYGHPSPEVLELLAKYDIKTLRTDKNGDIVFRTDGEKLFLSTEK